ncbi:hypothetical protein GKE82_23830 [Conexibacter sp. W3-3-2]|uniref:hypothetical protein n=1 Tax=Conexibacter sp. W3-3-2 TaxID=2675227 RepID=UPI0012B6CFB4|nr:hypothetical protein [Conexibacter sp. W3-3-2]MTD47237.1 hypothetical protein [Conexibacter sp. W3-3-2]
MTREVRRAPNGPGRHLTAEDPKSLRAAAGLHGPRSTVPDRRRDLACDNAYRRNLLLTLRHEPQTALRFPDLTPQERTRALLDALHAAGWQPKAIPSLVHVTARAALAALDRGHSQAQLAALVDAGRAVRLAIPVLMLGTQGIVVPGLGVAVSAAAPAIARLRDHDQAIGFLDETRAVSGDVTPNLCFLARRAPLLAAGPPARTGRSAELTAALAAQLLPAPANGGKGDF